MPTVSRHVSASASGSASITSADRTRPWVTRLRRREYRRAGALSTGAVERAIGTFAVEHSREASLTAQRSGPVAQLNWKIEFDDCQSLRLSKSAPKSRV